MKTFNVWLSITHSYNGCYAHRYTERVAVEAETAEEAIKKAKTEKREDLKQEGRKTSRYRIVAMDYREI